MLDQSENQIAPPAEPRHPPEPAARATGTSPRKDRPGLGLIGVGAFGAFCVPHLAPFFELRLHDPDRDAATRAARQGGRPADLATAAAQDIVVLAVPLARLEQVARAIAPLLKPGALVVDVCSIKTRPLAILHELLPPTVEIVGTHPLFGPQSGRDGIRGLRIALCAARGGRAALLHRFLREKLGLKVAVTTPEQHDREMAYVQGLTHLIARIVLAMELPSLAHSTVTFEHLMRMVETVRHDSDALFRTITRDNPYGEEVRQRFLEAAMRLSRPAT
jgi:prephenate dehydrogenase